MTVKRAQLLIASSENSADFLWATQFFVPDPCILIQKRGRKYLVVSDLEYARAKREAAVHTVWSHKEIVASIKHKRRRPASFIDALDQVLKRLKIRAVEVPPHFSLKIADELRRKRYRVIPGNEPFFPGRAIKTEAEVDEIRKVIRGTERAIRKAIEVLQKSKIRRGALYYRKRRLTSESLKQVINMSLLEQGMIAKHSIVAGGKQAADPHCQGTGPLRPFEPIVMDIFPRSEKSGYHADITRTVCRGRASDRLRAMYRAVAAAEKAAIEEIRHNAQVSKVHAATQEALSARGFETKRINGKPQGFIHSTGHGLGLEIHEFPRIGEAKDRLLAGHVVTVEPGLYYEDLGGIRLEDDVLVTQCGAEVLSRLPKRFEIL